MSTTERSVDRGTRRAKRILTELAEELREARLSAGVSQTRVATATGVSRQQISRVERAAAPKLSFFDASRMLSVVGRELAVRAYPVGPPIRDAAHVALLERLRARVSPAFRWRTEAPVAPGDARAFDVCLEGAGVRIGVEAETRLRDLQALQRRIHLKQHDSGVDRLIVVVRGSHANRRLLREYRAHLSAAFPVGGRKLLRALVAGRDPGGNGFVVL